MMNKTWKDEKGNCKCESCGKKVPQNKLYFDRGLSYCKACYNDIQHYNAHKKK